MPRKPRKSRVQTEEDQQLIRDWEAIKLHEIELQPKGNSITQQLYKNNILPLHISHIKQLEQRFGHEIYFQEDNDPSHGTRSTNNVCAQLKRTSQLV
jgi:hypothetical protein